MQKELSAADTPHTIIRPERSKAIALLNCFGIGYSKSSADNIPVINLRIKPDPLFGPLIEIENPGFKSIMRITPLTDKDLDEILHELKLKEETGTREVLGRLSQMIEEIPWLRNFEAGIVAVNEPLITGELILTLMTGGAERPPY